ncbi:hypothetical protein PB2503_03487 [Parvularcula bermudensis HTCC2503]|uniref:Uncharacterized protein n=1 Tax=Parvularcula bermudensis (strain ATCC BAA-594 / HTCC2503 / KCTC 12087) TaxID=314260 RepID=E0TDL7_PARBH|nr:hypothetical protein [Parvularcula bermudensis]ADM08772.1 hypothetical protein PB2503_03487 [Parvularcula bermudensis HTCC2503]
MKIQVPHQAGFFLDPEIKDMMPIAWQEEFAQYRFFYAPAYRDTARQLLGDLTVNSYVGEASSYRRQLAEFVPTQLKSEVPKVQYHDWETLGSDQIRSAMKETNLGFSKLVLAMILLQLMTEKRNDLRNTPDTTNVFDKVKIHPALFIFQDFDADKFREIVIHDSHMFRELQQATQQRNTFFEDIAEGRPATYHTLEAIRNWLIGKHTDIAVGDIVPITERGQLKPAQKERVRSNQSV